ESAGQDRHLGQHRQHPPRRPAMGVVAAGDQGVVADREPERRAKRPRPRRAARRL
ncbi:MAG: hypothetical protein AVDCRST_MAG19-247, partial [uncultured Thermomicrobiales bacterium]